MPPRALILLPVIAWLAVACAPKPAPVDDPPKKKPTRERLPADAVLWEGPMPDGVDAMSLLEKDGKLTKAKDPDEEGTRSWPYAVDQWALARNDLGTLLEPHVGRTVRVRGHYKKIYDHGTWVYEVEPVKITALADPVAQ